MMKFRLAFYAAAVTFAVLANNTVDAQQVSSVLSQITHISPEQLSEAAQAVQQLN